MPCIRVYEMGPIVALCCRHARRYMRLEKLRHRRPRGGRVRGGSPVSGVGFGKGCAIEPWNKSWRATCPCYPRFPRIWSIGRGNATDLHPDHGLPWTSLMAPPQTPIRGDRKVPAIRGLQFHHLWDPTFTTECEPITRVDGPCWHKALHGNAFSTQLRQRGCYVHGRLSTVPDL